MSSSAQPPAPERPERSSARDLLREARDMMRQSKPVEDDFPILDERVEAPAVNSPQQKVVVPPQPKNTASWVLRSGAVPSPVIAQNPIAKASEEPANANPIKLSAADEARLIEAVLNRLDLYGEQKLAEHIERSLQPLVKKLADALTRQVAMDATGLIRQQIAKAIARELEKQRSA